MPRRAGRALVSPCSPPLGLHVISCAGYGHAYPYDASTRSQYGPRTKLQSIPSPLALKGSVSPRAMGKSVLVSCLEQMRRVGHVHHDGSHGLFAPCMLFGDAVRLAQTVHYPPVQTLDSLQAPAYATHTGALTLVEKVILESVRCHSPLSGMQTTDERGRHGTTGLHQSLLIGQSDCRYRVPFS